MLSKAIEQYNELVLELSRVTEQIEREAAAREEAQSRLESEAISQAKQLADLRRDLAEARAIMDRRETENRNLEQRVLEIQSLPCADAVMDADLRKYPDIEIAARDETIGSERRLREAGEFRLFVGDLPPDISEEELNIVFTT